MAIFAIDLNWYHKILSALSSLAQSQYKKIYGWET